MDTTNEPVAWIIDVKMTDGEDNFIWNTGDYPDWQVKDWIPLYIHPVKEKGLPRSSPSPMNQACLTRSDNYISDEIIEQLAKQFGVVGLHEDAGLYEFARAILRKAQEK